MKIGVISDTHDRIPPGLVNRLRGIDELWHLGDVCEPSVLNLLMELECPIRVVRGNCDLCMDWPLTLNRQQYGVHCHLVHIPPDKNPPDCSIVLHGHTHVPRDEMIHGVRWLNPGSAGRANRGAPPSVGHLEILPGPIVHWRLIRL